MSTQLLEPRTTTQSTTVGSARPTIGSTWLAVAGREVDDELVDWPPDMFAFTEVILDRAEAYRFAVSPPIGRRWPPATTPPWSEAVAGAARSWSDTTAERPASPPELVLERVEGCPRCARYHDRLALIGTGVADLRGATDAPRRIR